MPDPAFRLPAGILPGGRFADWRPATPAYVVCDVDGTLVGPAASASPGVAAAIARAQEHGLRVGFATGRMRQAVQPLWEQLRAVGPHVLHNGAEVRFEGHTIAAWPLTDDQLAAILAIARRLDAYAELYVEDGFYVTAMVEAARAHWDILGHEPLGVVSAVDQVPGPVLKATFAAFGTPIDEIVAAIGDAGMRAGPAGSPLTPGIMYVNATHPDAGKGAAVTRAAAAIGVGLDATVAVGDATNDLPMLAVVGTAIAMGQAPDEVRDAAHLVVPGVDDDGVADALDACVGWREESAG